MTRPLRAPFRFYPFFYPFASARALNRYAAIDPQRHSSSEAPSQKSAKYLCTVERIACLGEDKKRHPTELAATNKCQPSAVVKQFDVNQYKNQKFGTKKLSASTLWRQQ